MKIAYLEPLGGASGNMLLGAALHSGWPRARLEHFLQRLDLAGWHLHAERVLKRHLAALHLDFHVEAGPDHRHLGEIRQLIRASDLPGEVQESALAVFERLGQAEADVHGIALEEVHFHEVGATDAILDIVGFCSWLHDAEVEELYCAPLPFGRGVIHCAHGVFPNPAPATVQLLRGLPQRGVEVESELVTPTGAALLSTLARFTVPPLARFESVGYGAGTRELPFPNVIRLQVGHRGVGTRRSRHDTAEEMPAVPSDEHVHPHEHAHPH